MLGLMTAPVALVNMLPPVACLVSAAATAVLTAPEFSPTVFAIFPVESINPSTPPCWTLVKKALPRASFAGSTSSWFQLTLLLSTTLPGTGKKTLPNVLEVYPSLSPIPRVVFPPEPSFIGLGLYSKTDICNLSWSRFALSATG